MINIGRKIYFEVSTGNVIQECGERSGSVIETTQDQDFEAYTALNPYLKSAVGVIKCVYGYSADNFSKYSFHIDITKTPIDETAIVWDIATPWEGTLPQAQVAKVDQITDLYNQTLEAGFTSSCTGAPIVYDYSASSQAKWSKLFIGLSIPGALPDEVFPLAVTIKDGTTVLHTKAQLTQLCGDVSLWELQLEAKYQAYTNATGLILSATTAEEVNAITW